MPTGRSHRPVAHRPHVAQAAALRSTFLRVSAHDDDRPGSADPAEQWVPENHPDKATLSPEVLGRQVRAFRLWDWGISAFSAVILTFVFSTYLTAGVAPAGLTDPAAAQAASTDAASTISLAQAVASVVVALLAPLLGRLADTGGYRNRFLTVATVGAGVSILLLAMVGRDPAWLVPGAILVALGAVFVQLAEVFVNSVLPQISTSTNRGRISGSAWAMGYFGSILCLALVLVLFILDGGVLGLPTQDGTNMRGLALFTGTWVLLFCTPLMRRAPTSPRAHDEPRWNPLDGYRQIIAGVMRAWREDRRILHYLLASAIYRDGLGAVFAMAGVVAASAYGLQGTQIIMFGILANLSAGLGVWLGGRADDMFGPRVVIITSLTVIIVCGVVLFSQESVTLLWTLGLALTFFVGPVNSSSRNLLTRLSEPHRYTENFGLYAMTGRAFGFLGTTAFAVFTTLMGSSRGGMIGVLLVMLIGLLAFLPLTVAPHEDRARSTDAGQ